MALTESQIQELYVAYFGRPADVEGKAYWSGSSTGVSTVLEFAANMHSQSEFQDAYGSKKTATQVNQIYQNLFSRDADADGLNYWTGQIANGSLELAEIAVHLIWAAKNNTGGSADKTALENKVAAATEFTNDVAADATAQLAYTADDADAFTTAKTFITGITTTAATAAEIDTQVSSIVSTYNINDAKGVTYSLATTADDLTGGTKNDTFAGVVDADTAANNTFTALDSLDGGAGTDTLTVTFASDAGNTNTFPAATISNIETFSIKNQDDDDAVTVDFANISGETTVKSNLSTSAVTFSNLASGTNVDIIGNTSLTNGALDYGFVAAATASTLDIMDGVTAGAVTETGSGLLTTTINSTGAANTIGALGVAASVTSLNINATTNLTTGAITSAAVTTLTITGAGDVDIDAGALDADTDVIDASASTGDVDILVGNIADNTGVSADLTVTTGSGDDDVDLTGLDAADEISITLGAGNDIVYIDEVIQASSTTSPGDVLAGGAGTDTLSALTATLNAHATTTTVSGFEKINITDEHSGSLDVADFGTGITTVTLAAGSHSGNAGDITFNAGASVLNISDVNDGNLALTAAGTATTDSLTINLLDIGADALSDETLTITKIETVTLDTDLATSTLTAQVLENVSLTADTGGTTTFNVVGANALSIDAITANTVDFSGSGGAITQTTAMVGTASGTNTLDGGAGDDTLIGDTNDTTNITGGAGDDDITGSSDTAGETISGGAGDDTINSSAGSDTITGGAGNDTITLGAATQTVDAGDGDDTVYATNYIAYGYNIIGGAGTDILDVTAAEVIGDGAVVSGFEQLNVDGNVTIDLDTYANNTFSTVQLETHTYTLQSVRSEVIQLIETLGGDLTVTGESVSGSSDTVSFKLKASAMFDTGGAGGTTADIDVDAVETINIETDDSDDATFGTATFQIDGDDINTINITGDSGVALTGSALTTLNTIDGSGATIGGVSTATTIAGIVWDSDNVTVGDTTSYTGTNGKDTFTGGSVTDDTFSGGLGIDTLVYDGRTDTFTGGGGNDKFDVNALGTTTGSQYLTITDLAVGDTIDFAGIDDGTDATSAIANQTLGAKHTLGSSATLTNYLDTACATDTSSAASAIDWFQFGGNTYITIDNSTETTFVAGQDGIVKLTGEIDLSTSTTTSAVLTVVTV